jgi:hypothetical protein
MSDFLERLERQLVAAVEEGAALGCREGAAGGDTPRAGRARGLPHRAMQLRGGPRRAIPVGLLAATLALLVGAAVAIAITGVLAPGAAVRPATPPAPSAGTGAPLPGRSRLLAQAPDPAGGPPWGMRLVHTTRGLQCIQLGRVQDGQLGLLGTNGAFGDDGRFHPLPPDVLGRGGQSFRGGQAFVTCQPPGQHTTMEAGLLLNGAWSLGGRRAHRPRAGDSARGRSVSFGLLGPKAVSVSYLAGGRVHTVAVAPGSGAYLVVLANAKPDSLGSGGGASGEGLLSPQGALSLITYRVRGRLCTEPNPSPRGPHGGRRLAHCPRSVSRLHRPTIRRLHRPIGVRRLAHGDLLVTFTAPYAVRSAVDQYSVQIPDRCHRSTVGIPLERDVRAGEVVRMRVQRPFAWACGASLTVQVYYEREGGRYGFDPRAASVIGEARIGRRGLIAERHRMTRTLHI